MYTEEDDTRCRNDARTVLVLGEGGREMKKGDGSVEDGSVELN